MVRRLRAAGAVIVGKTNAPELAAWPFTASSQWGHTRNPWSLAHDPGGSSGGSAVAVAAGLAALALGDDLGGSIRVPAACTGVFGLEPRRDLVSQAPAQRPGEDAGGPHHRLRVFGLTVYGPLTRTVDDAAVALGVLAGLSTARASTPARLRIGVCLRAPIPVAPSEDTRKAVAVTAKRLEALGHDVVTVAVPYRRDLAPGFFARYLRGMAEEYAALAEPERTEPRTRALARLGRRVPRWAIDRALVAAAAQRAALAPLFAHVNVLLTPVLASTPALANPWSGYGLLRTLWKVARYSPYAATWNVTDHAACALPVGLDAGGLPTAVQLVAEREDPLLDVARALEQGWPPPRWEPSDDYLRRMTHEPASWDGVMPSICEKERERWAESEKPAS